MSAHEPHSATAWLGGYRSIVCAVELNAEADVVLQAAGLIAQAYRAKVCLLHIEPFDKPGGQASAQSLRDAFQKALDVSRPESSVDTTVHLLDAAVPEGIVGPQLKKRQNLVIVGRGHQKEAFHESCGRISTRLFANRRVRFSAFENQCFERIDLHHCRERI